MRLDRALLKRLLHFGFPSGLQMLLDVLGWSVFVLLIGRIGHIENTATTLAFSVSSVAFMPIWGFGMAASIIVGQKLGENRDDLAARATSTVLWISIGYMAIISLLYVITPNLFLASFFRENSDSAAVQQAIYTMAVNLLCFVAAYNLLDAVMIVYVSAIKGAGDTRFILKVTIIMATLLTSLSYLAVEMLQLSIYWCWSLAIGWVWVMGVTFWLRYRTGKWRSMRVIETEHHELPHEQTAPAVAVE